MATSESKVGKSVTEASLQFGPDTICCYPNAKISRFTSPYVFSSERLLAAQALQLVMRLDHELRVARADWNHDRFRRIMRARYNAVSRVRRRWLRLNPVPAIGLGRMRRRYHANLGRYLYEA